MGKIYYIMGKSSSGKDTLFRKIKQELPMLQTVTLYTTRPKREGEREGVEYHFVTDEQMHIFERQGKVVELRTYNTVHGAWKYATIEDGQVNLAESDYLMIGTLESYGKLKKYYGAAYLVPVYIEVEDGERLNRALTQRCNSIFAECSCRESGITGVHCEWRARNRKEDAGKVICHGTFM